MANIVEIVIKGIDKTKEGFTGPIENLTQLEKRLDQVTPFFVGLAVAAEAAFVVMAKGFLDNVSALDKMSQRIGVSVQSLSTLDFAAHKKGVEDFQVAMKKLDTALFDANSGSLESIKTFNNLGVSFRELTGNVVNPERALIEIADKFHDMPDGVTKSAEAVKLFGRSGIDMIPFLNLGSEGIQKIRDHAEELGYTLDKETVLEVRKFKKAMVETGEVLQGIVNQVVKEVLPMINDLIESLKSSGDNIIILNTIVWSLVDGFNVLIFTAKLLVRALEVIWEGMKLVGDMVSSLLNILYDFFNTVASGLVYLARAFYNLFFGTFEETKAIVEEGLSQVTMNFGMFKEDFGVMADGIIADWDSVITKISDQPAFPKLGQQEHFERKSKPGAFEIASRSPDEPPDDSEAIAKRAALYKDALLKMTDMERTFRAEQLRGSDAAIAKVEDEYAKRLEAIGKLDLEEGDSNDALIEAAQVREQKLAEIKKQGLDIQADMSEAAKNGEVGRFMELVNSEKSIDLIRLEQQRTFMQEYAAIAKQAHISMWSFATSAANTFTSGLANALSSIVLRTQTVGQAIRELGKAMIAMVVNFIAQYIAAMLVKAALDLLFGTKAAAANSAFAIKAAAAWAPAATAAAIGSFGFALGFAAGVPLAMAANTGIAVAMAGGGAAHGGLDFVPMETTYLLQQGERVVSPKQNQDLTAFLDGKDSGGASGGQTFNVNLQLDGRELAATVWQMTRSGELIIHQRAVRATA